MDSLFFKDHFVKISKFFSTNSIGSSSQLVWSTDFGAQFLHGLGPWAPDQFWAVFWIHFGPYFGFLAAHHESIWILGGEASWKLKIVSLHGEWGGELMGKLILRLIGALSRAWRREKRRGFDGWRFGTIKEEKNQIWRDFFFLWEMRLCGIMGEEFYKRFLEGFFSWVVWGSGPREWSEEVLRLLGVSDTFGEALQAEEGDLLFLEEK